MRSRVSRTNTADAPYVRRMWRSVCQRKYIPFPRIRIQNDLRRKSGQKTRLAGGIQRARVAPFDSRGGKAKPFTYSRNAPPAYECGRARLPPTRSSLLLSSIPVSSRPFVRRRQRTAARSARPIPPPPPSRRVTRVRASAERHARQPLRGLSTVNKDGLSA